MEELSNMCRICLADDVGMRLIANTHLQEMYESLTLLPLQTKDSRPTQVCYICCAQLQNCLRLQKRSLRSEELFAWVLSSGVLPPLGKGSYTKRLRVQHPVISLSVGNVSQNITDNETSVNNDGRKDMLDINVHVKLERDDEDIKMKPQEEHDTQIDDDIQCSHLEDTLDVMKREPDYVETDAEDTNLEIDDITIEENEPRSVHRSSLSANDICPKTVKIVLERMVLNDTTPVTGVPALQQLAKNDSFFSTEPVNANVVVRGKLTETETFDKLDVTLHKHLDIYKQTSESDICSNKERYRSKAHLELRVTRTHTGEKQFQCDFCNKRFTTNSNLTQHINIHTGEKQFQCDFCNKCFTTNGHLTTHMFTHTGEKSFGCDVCNKTFALETLLKQHMYTHTGEKPFQCDVCNKRFCFKLGLKRHISTHTGEKSLKCDICNKTITTKSYFTRHMQIHTGEKPFQCDVCNKRFCFKSRLKQHLYTHTGEKSLKCDICNKTIGTKSYFTQHMQIHTGEKPFKCDMCNKRFTWKTSLKQHMYTHTGEKPFKCHVCNKSFGIKRLLTSHMYIHTGEKRFKCDMCNKCYTSKVNLIQHMYTQHMRKHTGNKPFECNVCNKCFPDKDSLKLHIVNTHW